MVKKVSYKRPPCCPIFFRIFTLALFFSISVFTAATWFSWGLNWIMDIGSGSTNTYPLWQCPDFYFNTDGRALNQGPRCRMSLSYNDSTIFAMRAYNYEGTYNLVSASDSKSPGQCVVPGSGEETITCYSLTTCQRSCRRNVFSTGGQLVSQETCPDPDSLVSNDESECSIIMAYSGSEPAVYFTHPCKGVSAGSFCDSDYRVTPSNMIAVRGLAAGSLLIILIWFIAEMVLWKVDCDLRREAALGKALQDETLAPKKETLIHMVERAWEEEYAKNMQDSNLGGSTVADFTPKSHRSGGHLTVPNSNSNVSGVPVKDDRSIYSGYTGITGGSAGRTALDSRDPKKRFESSGWRRKIRQWTRLKEEKKTVFNTRAFIRNVLMNFFFLIILIFTMWIILTYSPNQMQARGSLVEVLKGEASIWNAHSWLDIMIFVDILLDVGLFLIAVAVVHWPKPPVFTRHLHAAADEALAKLEAGEEDDETEEEARRLRGRESTGSLSEGSLDDNKTLSSRPSHESLAFVVNQSLTSDVCLMIACHESTLTAEKYEVFTNTLRSALMVFPPSHIFVCDNGGASHPVDDTQMATKEVHPDINYLYVPEGNKTFAFYWCNRYWIPFLARHGRIPDFKYAIIIDDDVPLPADLHIPHEHLKQNPNIKAVHFPITAASPDGNPNLLVRCQDIEYKMAAVHKYFQSTVSRTLSCHGAIALWKRDTMDAVFYDHDTVFHGEDLYMGLSLLRRRDDSKIISSPQSIVPTYAPDTMGMLFRQRVKSWEITSHKKTFTYLLEVFHPWSLCHGPSWALKPYFVQELLTIMLDWLRMFLLCGLLLRDWLGLCIMMGMFTLILYMQVIVFQVIYLRQRPDLKSSFCTILTFPWYRLCGLFFRLCALCQNLLVYSKERKNVKIGVREDEIRDIPPLPPHPEVNWFDVWQPKPDPPEETRKRSKRGSSMRGSVASRASRTSRTLESEEPTRGKDLQ